MVTSAARRPASDSPWFWAYLFGTAALLALAIIGPKYGRRQAQIERQFQGREWAAQNRNGAAEEVEMSTADKPLISLRPLFLSLAAITSVAWLFFWWRHVRHGRRIGSAAETTESPSRETPGIPPGV